MTKVYLLLVLASGAQAFTAPAPSQRRISYRQAGNTAFLDDDVVILDGLDEPFEQAQWMMPSIVERALIHSDASVDPHQLMERIDMSSSERIEAVESLRRSDGVMTTPALTPQECAKVRKFVRQQIVNDGIDNVDGCPDWQVNISEKKLEKILGKAGKDRLWNVPSMLENGRQPQEFDRVGIFIRMYQRGTRPWMPFHRDGNQWTVNVALNDDDEYVGGRLLALHNRELQVLERQEGDATCHQGSIFHAVSAITEGTRYSMILFFHQAS